MNWSDLCKDVYHIPKKYKLCGCMRIHHRIHKFNLGLVTLQESLDTIIEQQLYAKFCKRPFHYTHQFDSSPSSYLIQVLQIDTIKIKLGKRQD